MICDTGSCVQFGNLSVLSFERGGGGLDRWRSKALEGEIAPLVAFSVVSSHWMACVFYYTENKLHDVAPRVMVAVKFPAS